MYRIAPPTLLCAVILGLFHFPTQVQAQLPFGPPPVDDGFVPVGPPPAAPAVAPRPTPRPYVPPVPTTPPPEYAPKPTSPAPVAPAPVTSPPGNPYHGNTSPTGELDSSLVGSRYAPQGSQPQPTTPAPTEPQPRFGPQPPQGDIQFPVAREPGSRNLAQAEINEHCKVLARVGPHVVLGSEVLPRVDKVMEENKDRIPPSHWETQRLLLIREALDGIIDTKLIVADLYRTMPEENLPNLERQVDEQFEKNRIPTLMKALKVSSRAELDTALRREGSTLADQRRIFFENAVAGQWLRQSIQVDKEVPHDAMWRYYQEHLEDYYHASEVDWQELFVSFDKHPTREAAFQKIAQMGNDVLQKKVPFELVAKTHSDGITAKDGGKHEKTTRGSLKSKAIDEAIFALQPGQMSQIIEEPDGFYIVRPIENRPEHHTPFRDAQVKIAETIRQEGREEAVANYQAGLRKEIPVWTIFDDPAVAAKLPDESELKRN